MILTEADIKSAAIDILDAAIARIESDPTASIFDALNPPAGEDYEMRAWVYAAQYIGKALDDPATDGPLGSSPDVIAKLRAIPELQR